MNYTWIQKETYIVKVKIQDEHGLKRDWLDPLSANIPRSKQVSSTLSMPILQRFLNASPILL